MVDFNKLIHKTKPVTTMTARQDAVTEIKGMPVSEYPVAVNEPTELLNDLSFADSDFDFAEPLATIEPAKIGANKAPKEELIQFLKTAELDIPYTIQFNGDYNTAETYIHRMRVELSRFRAKIIKLNKPLDHFHILKKSITVESDSYCTIVLLKTYNRKKSNASREIDDVLAFLTVKD